MTDATFGFDTAVEVATECIDRLFTTATSHSRVFVVEVMGRYAGWIALNSGMAAGAHAILIPEIPFDLRARGRDDRQREARGARFAIVVVAEGAIPRGGERSVIGQSVGQAERLGGIGARVASELERLTGKEARTMVLGHLLRGGTPTSLDRLLGLRFGAAAVRGLEIGHRGVMVALQPPIVNYVPLVSAVEQDALRTARLRHDPRRPRPRRLLRRLAARARSTVGCVNDPRLLPEAPLDVARCVPGAARWSGPVGRPSRGTDGDDRRDHRRRSARPGRCRLPDRDEVAIGGRGVGRHGTPCATPPRASRARSRTGRCCAPTRTPWSRDS